MAQLPEPQKFRWRAVLFSSQREKDLTISERRLIARILFFIIAVAFVISVFLAVIILATPDLRGAFSFAWGGMSTENLFIRAASVAALLIGVPKLFRAARRWWRAMASDDAFAASEEEQQNSPDAQNRAAIGRIMREGGEAKRNLIVLMVVRIIAGVGGGLIIYWVLYQ